MGGIRTCGVHSDVDRDSLHVALPTKRLVFGPAPSAQSYLEYLRDHQRRRRSSTWTQSTPATASLAESSYFAEICEACNIKFIGPSSKIDQR